MLRFFIPDSAVVNPALILLHPHNFLFIRPLSQLCGPLPFFYFSL